MSKLESMARKLDALGHPLRLRILMSMAKEGTDMYLSEIAGKLNISRSLAKIHLKKLESAGLVKSRAVLVEDEAKALRYYALQDFDIRISPTLLVKEADS